MPDTTAEDASTQRGWGDSVRLSNYGYPTAMPRRFYYLVGCSYVTTSRRAHQGHSQNFTLFRPMPVSSMDDVAEVRGEVTAELAKNNPVFDAEGPGWRDTLVVMGCSLLRVEVERDGEWVLAAWQPWGPVPQEADRG